ncbi:hypothetical protein [Parafrankia elaeagni]|uniref:hypothetical protein n=1 Tax=Parafrankia elaeagni TaxID=222534 RepID=UPI000377C56B|nr:hypothetical protein [Parafrankia elaeagni]
MPKLDQNHDVDLDFRDADALAEAEESRRRDDVARTSSGPVDPEAMAAADGLSVSEAEAEAYREHAERGAHQQGEGAPEV